jgi:hypothetical protein
MERRYIWHCKIKERELLGERQESLHAPFCTHNRRKRHD